VLTVLIILGVFLVPSGTVASVCLIAYMVDRRRARRSEWQERRAEVLVLRGPREVRR
jgi:uncharacterized membrane protein YsdA (DUF1294 family)